MWDQDQSDRGPGRMARAVPDPEGHPRAAMIDSRTTSAIAGTTWPSGLTDHEAAQQRARGGGSQTAPRGSVSLRRILRRNVFTILNGVLFGVSLVLLAFGLYLDAAFTAVPVATNVVVAVVLEVDAKRKLDRLTLITRPEVTVRRSGHDRRTTPDDLVVGDAVIVERGDQAVVDGTLTAGAIEVDESVLTGESEPVSKRSGDLVRSGCICVSGTAAIEVTAVGDATYASGLAREARRGSDERTPLRRDLDTLILAIGILTVAAAIPVALALHAAGNDLFSTESIQAAAVLVALVPQGLAIMATVTYALAAVRISRAGAIVHRIDAVESMSRVDTLCLDKTGTLTTQRLVLDSWLAFGDDSAGTEAILRVVAASMTSRTRTLDALGVALPGVPIPPLAEIPFSSERRWSGVLLGGTQPRLLLLGAAETLLGSDDAEVGAAVTRLTGSGLRVLLVAEADPSDLPDPGSVAPPPARPLAILAFREELRPDAADTLRQLVEAKVDLRVISGDDPATVAAIAATVGIAPGIVLSGLQIEAMDDEELAVEADRARVFGRIGPEDKRRLVAALRASGHYVGMTGDGVNDVLALRGANLGIAMESGSPAARAVAGLILLGDRFDVLPRAIVEGQRVVSSMIAVASLLLARTIYMLLIVVAAAILGVPFPFTPRNNAVLALVTVGLPTLVLALWVPPIRSPRSVVARILRFAVPSGIAVAILALPVLMVAFGAEDPAIGRSVVTTLTVFTGIALIPILFPAVADRSGPVGRGGDRRPLLLAGAMVALYGAILATPLGRSIFELEPLPVETLAALFAFALVWMATLIVLLRLGVPARAWSVVVRRRPSP
jgi:cation-transporting ATPase E